MPLAYLQGMDSLLIKYLGTFLLLFADRHVQLLVESVCFENFVLIHLLRACPVELPFLIPPLWLWAPYPMISRIVFHPSRVHDRVFSHMVWFKFPSVMWSSWKCLIFLKGRVVVVACLLEFSSGVWTHSLVVYCRYTRSFFLVLFRFPFSWANPVLHCLLLIKYN